MAKKKAVKPDPSKIINLDEYRKRRQETKSSMSRDGVEFLCPRCGHNFELSWWEISAYQEEIEEEDGLDMGYLICPECEEQLDEERATATYENDKDDIPF